jgi:hypothetical protein
MALNLPQQISKLATHNHSRMSIFASKFRETCKLTSILDSNRTYKKEPNSQLSNMYQEVQLSYFVPRLFRWFSSMKPWLNHSWKFGCLELLYHFVCQWIGTSSLCLLAVDGRLPHMKNLIYRACLCRNILLRTLKTLGMPFRKTLANTNNWVICNYLEIPCHTVSPVITEGIWPLVRVILLVTIRVFDSEHPSSMWCSTCDYPWNNHGLRVNAYHFVDGVHWE